MASRVFCPNHRPPTGRNSNNPNTRSPASCRGTDPFGRAGLPGQVDRQFGERFGAAVLLSVIDGAIQAAVASQQSGGTVYVSPSGAPSVMTELLKERAAIPPRIVKAQGDRVAILVARTISFRS